MKPESARDKSRAWRAFRDELGVDAEDAERKALIRGLRSLVMRLRQAARTLESVKERSAPKDRFPARNGYHAAWQLCLVYDLGTMSDRLEHLTKAVDLRRRAEEGADEAEPVGPEPPPDDELPF